MGRFNGIWNPSDPDYQHEENEGETEQDDGHDGGHDIDDDADDWPDVSAINDCPSRNRSAIE